MTEKSWIIVIMWAMWGLATTALALKDTDNVAGLGLFGSIVLGIVTVRLFRKS